MEEQDTEPNSPQHSDTEQVSVQLTDEEHVPKKGSTSIIWRWFGYNKITNQDTDQTTVICKVRCRPVTNACSHFALIIFSSILEKM